MLPNWALDDGTWLDFPVAGEMAMRMEEFVDDDTLVVRGRSVRAQHEAAVKCDGR